MKESDGYLGYAPAEYKRFRKCAWINLLVFSLLYCCIYCTRLNLNAASPAIMETLGWATSDIGVLTGVLFWTYGLGQLINGRLAELTNPSKLLCAGAALSIVCSVIFSMESSLVIMAITWGLNGIFQSTGWGPGLALLSKW